MTDLLLLGSGDLTRPSAQAIPELHGPFIDRLQDHSIPLTTYQDFSLHGKPALLWKSDGLTAAIAE